jgi:predicted  nucleic acid-binding Zn-ribbon protein
MDSAFEEIKPQANHFRDKFQIIINSIKTLGKQLSDAEIKQDEVAQQYMPVINDAKSTILTAIQKETSDQVQEIRTFEDVLALRDRAKGLLNRLGETGGSHSRTMHSFFGKYAKVLKLELGLLDKEMKRLNELIDDYTEKTTSFMDCQESMARISSAISTEKEFVEKQKEINAELELLRSKENELMNKIEDFKKTEEFNAYMKSKEELAHVKNEVSNVLSDVNASFSRISRPLSKYTYEVGLDKESNYLMQSIMENPVNLMHDSKADQVSAVLNKVIEGMQKGRIATKHPEKDIENMNGLIANLHDYIRRYKEYDSSLRELQGKTSVVNSKLEKMNAELKSVRDDRQQRESYLNDCVQRVSNAKSVMDDELKKISDAIERATGSRIRIAF